MEFIKTYGELIVLLGGVVSALGVIYKLFRGWLKKLEGRFSTAERDAEMLQKMEDMDKEMLKRIDDRDKALIKKIDDLDSKIDAISQKNDDNEKDRLKDVLFRYGNFCRRGAVITSEEFRKVGQDFSKYTALGGNDIAHDEYEFIKDYYNNKRWEKK